MFLDLNINLANFGVNEKNKNLRKITPELDKQKEIDNRIIQKQKKILNLIKNC